MYGQRRSFLPYAVGIAGATGILAQTVLMRELVVAFYGNELTTGFLLGTWLLGTAFGSGVLGRYLTSTTRPVRSFAFGQLAASVLMPTSLLLVRLSPPIFGRTPGEISDLVPMFLAPLFWVFPLCVVFGFLFTSAVRALESEQPGATAASSIGWTYFAESIGASLGGLVVSFLLLPHRTSFEIVAMGAALNAVSSAALLWSFGPRPAIWVAILSVPAVAILPRFDVPTLRRVWQGMEIPAARNSVYGQNVVTELGNTVSFYVNGLLMFTWPDYLTAEQVAHIPLLEHPMPTRVLIIGGGVGDPLGEILKHRSVQMVDYVELDPTILELARRTLPDSVVRHLDDPRVHTHNLDGRRFVKETGQTYDVIIINLPDPHNVQVNRFYTLEFFREARERLAPGGVLAFEVTSSENAIGDELAEFLRCLRETLSQVFELVLILPGETNTFLAARPGTPLTDDPDELVRRLRERRIQTTYVREYYLPYRLSDERKAYLRSQLEAAPNPPINRDFKPIAYYFDVTLWSTVFTQSMRNALHFLRERGVWLVIAAGTAFFLTCIFLALREWSRTRDLRTLPVVMTILTVGFSEISLEVLAIIAFQAVFGYAYHELALIVTGYMVGLTFGSALSTPRVVARSSPRLEAVLAQLGFVLLLVGFLAILDMAPAVDLHGTSGFALRVSFPLLVALGGMIGGYQFPIANAILLTGQTHAGERAGYLYGVDLAGSSLGAYLVSSFLVPLAGMPKTLMGLALLNGVSLALLVAGWLAVRKQQ